MADELKRRAEDVLRKFHDLGDYYAEEIVAVNPDGTPISGGGGGGGGGGLTDVELRATPVPTTLNAATLAALEITELGANTLAALETIQVSGASASAQSSVPNAVATTTLLAPNAARRGATIYNDDAAATLRIKLGAAASAASFTYAIPPQGYYEVPFGYTGVIDGIASAASGNARITELT